MSCLKCRCGREAEFTDREGCVYCLEHRPDGSWAIGAGQKKVVRFTALRKPGRPRKVYAGHGDRRRRLLEKYGREA